MDPTGHGTHVAGIVGRDDGERRRRRRRRPARILPVTIADASGRATTSSLVRGIRYADRPGRAVINISFGGEGFSQIEQDAIDGAVRRGALVVAPRATPAAGRRRRSTRAPTGT